jgi:hypothetical protein
MPSDGLRQISSFTKTMTFWWCRAGARSTATVATASSQRELTFETSTSFLTRLRARFFGLYPSLLGLRSRPFRPTVFRFVKTTTQRVAKTSSISTFTWFHDFSETISIPLHTNLWMRASALLRPTHCGESGRLEVPTVPRRMPPRQVRRASGSRRREQHGCSA